MMNCKECFLWNAMGSEDRKRIDAEMKYCEEAYNYVWGDRNYLKNNDLPQIHGGFGRYRALKLRQAVLNKQHIIQIAPMYENTQTVIDYVMDDEKSHAITLKFEGGDITKTSKQLETFLYYYEKNN